MLKANRLFVRRVWIAVAIPGFIALVVFTSRVLLLAFAGVLGAVILNTAVEWIAQRTGLS